MQNDLSDGLNLRRTIAQTVAMRIREQILNGEIQGGERLRQDAIAKSFDTSIIPVREAFRQLEQEGLIELRSHRGAVATELTLSKAIEWINMRRLIESDIVGLAIDNLTAADISKAETLLAEFDAAIDQRIDMDRWSDLNWQFHATLYAPAKRPETMKVLHSLHKQCDRYVRLQLQSSDHIDRAHVEHRELLDVWKKHRKRETKSLLTKHIVGVANDLEELLKV